MPTPLPNPTDWRGQMCPQNLALHHPTAATPLQYATGGCPVRSGQPWSLQEIEAAIAHGNNASALSLEVVAFHANQLKEKLTGNQCHVVAWDDIKHAPHTHTHNSKCCLWQWCHISPGLFGQSWICLSRCHW
jgi:hypothetical protein